MAIDDKWRKLIPEQIHNVPDYPGVVEFTDILQETVLYIGHSDSLAQMLQRIFEKRPPEFVTVAFFRFHTTNDHSQEYNQLIEEYKETHGNLPPINIQKDTL